MTTADGHPPRGRLRTSANSFSSARTPGTWRGWSRCRTGRGCSPSRRDESRPRRDPRGVPGTAGGPAGLHVRRPASPAAQRRPGAHLDQAARRGHDGGGRASAGRYLAVGRRPASLLSSLRGPAQRKNQGMAETWMLDELAHAGPEHLDAAFIAGYDKKQGYPDPGEDLAAFEARGLGRSSTVVDIGAGTGQFADPRGAAVRARGRGRCVACHGGRPAAEGGHRGGGQPRLRARGVLQLRPRGAARGRRLHQERAAPGPGLLEGDRAAADRGHAAAGRRAAAAGSRSSTSSRGRRAEIFAGWFAGAAADPADGYTAADYAEHIRTEYSTYRWLLEPLLAAAGFEIIEVSFERRLYGAYTCVKR